MKKLILLFLLITAISVGAQKYVTFPTANAQWNINYNGSGTNYQSSIINYIQSGDTTLNGKTYKKVYQYLKYFNQLTYMGGLREENKRIYWKPFSNNGSSSIPNNLFKVKEDCLNQQSICTQNEMILYDFNKYMVGDTLFNNYSIGKIIAVDSVKIQNSYRKRYTLSAYKQTMGFQYTYDYVIEGIGSVKNDLFAQTKPLCTCIESPLFEFINFQQENQLLYKNPAYKNQNNVARWDDRDYLKTATQWYYSEMVYLIAGSNLKSSIDYNSVKSVGDTTINNHLCHKINHVRNRPTCYGYEQQVYVYQSNDTVYFLNSNTKKFSTLYVYGANQGDSWTVNYPQGAVKVQVDSISTLWAMGQWLKVQYVTYSIPFPNSGPAIFTHSSKIIEGIGDENYYFNSFIFYRPVCDDFSWSPDGLRCYVHPDYGTYKTGTLDCAYVTEVPDNRYNALRVFIHNNILTVDDTEHNSFQVELMDVKGAKMAHATLTNNQNTLDITNLDKGMYLYRISANGALLKAGKIVKN